MNSIKKCEKIHNSIAKTGEMDEKSFKICCEVLKEYATSRKDMFTFFINKSDMKPLILLKIFGSSLIASCFKKLDNAGIFKIAFGEESVVA